MPACQNTVAAKPSRRLTRPQGRRVPAALIFSVLLSGCAVGVEGRFPAGRPQLTRTEAVSIATQTALRRGFAALRVAEVERDDDEWRVQLRVGPPARGALLVRVDAWNGDVVRFTEDVKWVGRGHHDDDHDGDHGNHRGRGDADDDD